MKKLILGVLCASSLVALAVPHVTDVTMTQNAFTRLVTITYKLLDEPGIVTLDVQTNGVSIGGEYLTLLAEDVNRKIENDANAVRRILWRPDQTWPNQLITNGSVRAVVTAWATNAPPPYMACDLAAPNTIRFYPSAEAVPGGVTNIQYKTTKLLMRKIPAANVEWRMGANSSTDPGVASSFFERETVHTVTLTEDFYIGVYEFTQKQYKMIDTSYTYTGADDLPVIKPYSNIRAGTWPDAGAGAEPGDKTGIQRLRAQTGINTFDLPTDAQWEFACRAGTDGPYNAGTSVDDVAWYSGNANALQVVGQKLPNRWGLYDMHGNAAEWCLDWYATAPYAAGSSVQDPVGPASGSQRCVRSGSYSTEAARVRSAARTAVAAWQTYYGETMRPVCKAGIE